MDINDVDVSYYNLRVQSVTSDVDETGGTRSHITLVSNTVSPANTNDFLYDIAIMNSVRMNKNPAVTDQYKKLLEIIALSK